MCVRVLRKLTFRVFHRRLHCPDHVTAHAQLVQARTEQQPAIFSSVIDRYYIYIIWEPCWNAFCLTM